MVQAQVDGKTRIAPGDKTTESEVFVRRGVVKRISWGAVLAGTATAMTTQVLLTALGAGVGLAVIGPSSDSTAIAVGAGLWWLISGWIALFFGGAIAGRLSSVREGCEGAIHGMMVWAVTGVIGVTLLTTSSAAIIGGAMGPLTRGYAGWSELHGKSGLEALGMGNSGQKIPAGRASSGNSGVNYPDTSTGSSTSPGSRSGTMQEPTPSGNGSTGNPGAPGASNYGGSTNPAVREPSNSGSQGSTSPGSSGTTGTPGTTAPSGSQTEGSTNGTAPGASTTNMAPAGRWSAEQNSLGIPQDVAGRSLTPEEVAARAEQARAALAGASLWSFFALLIGMIVSSLGGYIGRPMMPLNAV